MIDAFVHDKDVYGTIASVAFNLPYEQCLEFNPETHEYQAEGTKRRTECKSVLLGVLYGRSVPSIGDQLYGNDKSLTDEEKTAKAQKVYDAVMNNFPGLRSAMLHAQESARKQGFTETILGRRRHLPDMTLPEFEFKAMPGYINPDIDPLDPSTLDKRSDIPDRIVKQLTEEFSKLKYYGQIVKRSKQLEEEHIRVINNRPKITDATRQCLNCVDKHTEILTTDGWKHYDEIHEGQKIYSYDYHSKRVVNDTINSIYIYDEPTYVITFENRFIDAVCTVNHKWLCLYSNNEYRFVESKDLFTANSRLPIVNILSDNILASDVSFVSIDDCQIDYNKANLVWCVTTKTHTWIARRNRKVYITGNSIIQGSAADQTKMAILLIANDKRWKEIGARILTPIHDEILVEAPIENREEAAKLLSGLMVEAADYLPFPSKCDVETTYRWYGLEAPCPYKKATSIDTQDEEEIKWLQYHLVEMEYLLPVIKDESGEARGNAAYGVNGIRTDEMEKSIFDYMSTRSISSNEFINRIEQEVSLGY